MADDNLLDGGQRSDEQHEDEQRAAEPPRGLLLIGVYSVLFLRYVIATFLSAFFTPVATAWGISGSFNGLIFAAYPAGMSLTSLFAPQIVQRLGTRTAISLGLQLTSVLTLAFGLTPDAVDAWGGETAQYKWGFLGFYWLSGLLGSVAENAAIILATQQFPDRLGTVMASIGTVSGVGCMVGPVVGGVLYDLPADGSMGMRFRFPFFVCALASLALVLPLRAIMPAGGISSDGAGGEGRAEDTPGAGGREDAPDEPVSPATAKAGAAELGLEDVAAGGAGEARRGASAGAVCASPLCGASVLLGLGSTMLSGGVVATLDPTLSYRLSAPPFYASASLVSFVFMYSSAVYTLCSVPIGNARPPRPAPPRLASPRLTPRPVALGGLVDLFPSSSRLYKAVTASGFAVLALSFAILAPALPRTGPGAPPLSALPPAELNSVSAVMVAMGLKGVGSALSNNAVYPDMVLLLPPDKMTLASASGLWNAAYSLGWALGPLLGRLPSSARSAPPPPPHRRPCAAQAGSSTRRAAPRSSASAMTWPAATQARVTPTGPALAPGRSAPPRVDRPRADSLV